MKIKKIFGAFVSCTMAISILGSMSASALPAFDENYDDTAYGFSETFGDLLDVSDDEFLEMDTYHGTQNSDMLTWWQKYYFTNMILNNRSEYINLEQLGLTREEYPEDVSELMPLVKEKVSDAVAVMPKYSSFDGEVYDGAVMAVKNLTPTFYFSENDFDKFPNKVWLVKRLNDVFGDDIGYTLYYPNYPSEDNASSVIYIKFDMDDKLEMNKENLLYSARILCSLQQIDSAFFCSSGTNSMISDNVEAINSSKKVGDANADSKFDIRDAAYIARELSRGNREGFLEWADYNTDGKTDIRDAAAIARKMSEKK